MELGVPVVAAAQVNRQAESRSDNRPKLSDLRESGSIEQDADIVCLVHRPCYYAVADQEPDPQDAELIVAKHRAGRTGTLNLNWCPSLTRFESTAVAGRTTDEANEFFSVKPLSRAINE
jgi:replicative DNA helicase